MPGATIRKPRENRLGCGGRDGIDRLPRDQHRHDGGLAGPGRELQGDAQKIGVRFLLFAPANVRIQYFGTGGGVCSDATSASQIAVSTASMMVQRLVNGLNRWFRQC